jgi:hypothetical protein
MLSSLIILASITLQRDDLSLFDGLIILGIFYKIICITMPCQIDHLKLQTKNSHFYHFFLDE